jgi:hypothetical protein
MLDVYRDLIDELLGTPTEVRELFDTTGGEVPQDAIRLVAEMRDRDRAVLARVQTMTRERDPYLAAMRLPEVDATQDVTSLLAEMETARGDLVSLLINLSLRDWERTAIDAQEDEVTLADEVERHVEFDESQRRRLRALFEPR